MKTVNNYRPGPGLFGLVAASLLGLPGLIQAQPSAHYPPGIEGIKGASLPPPGIYLRDYNVAYYADKLNTIQGKDTGLDVSAFTYANVPRLVWITDLQVLGGNIGVDALLPLQYTDADIHAGRLSILDSSTFGIGDFFAEATWSTHLKKFDFSLGAGIWAPTGESAPPPTTRVGSGYWTGMFTAGATWYPDTEKKWALSALNRYEINTENRDTDTTPGQAYTLEWGLSRALSPTVDVGAIGYYQQQVTTDSGRYKNGERDRVAGVGPEVSVFYPKYTLGWSLRYAYEFMAEGRFQGHTVALTLTKKF